MAHECPACDARASLEAIGQGWEWCSCCASCVRFDAENRVVQIVHARKG